jgi:hypothetical protein
MGLVLSHKFYGMWVPVQKGSQCVRCLFGSLRVPFSTARFASLRFRASEFFLRNTIYIFIFCFYCGGGFTSGDRYGLLLAFHVVTSLLKILYQAVTKEHHLSSICLVALKALFMGGSLPRDLSHMSLNGTSEAI